MAKIVGVHGINHEYLGSNTIHSRWFPAIQDGLATVGLKLESNDSLKCAFYGKLFREEPSKSKGAIPRYGSRDISSDIEKELLQLWSDEVERLEGKSKGASKGGISQNLQVALRTLSRSENFSGLAEHIVIFLLKQVGAYLQDDEIRKKILQSVADCIEADTRILIGHSLGSVACYESLAAHPEWPVTHFISLGSPLGIQRLIFDKLKPEPINAQGQWPGSIQRWINIADENDIVALEKQLNPLFSGTVEDHLVKNGKDFHNAIHYLTSSVFGKALQLGLLDA